MPTPAQIDEQIKLEREQIRQGLERLRDNTIKLQDKEYASASVYGCSSIEELLPKAIEQIKNTAARAKRGMAGKDFAVIKQYLADIEPEAAAAIACKVTFDKVFSSKQKANQLQNVTDAIGKAIEDECTIRHYETNCPGLLHVLKENYWHRAIGTEQKVVVIKTLMKRYEVKHWEPWGRGNRIKLGGWLLDCICQASGWFDVQMTQPGGKRQKFIVPTPEFLEIRDEVMATAELFSPLAWPMLIEPNDWTNERQGGYILNEVMKGYDMVRRSAPCCIQGETPITFLNHIQKVAYTLNPFIVDVAETLQKRGIAIGKFIPVVELPLPNKPLDIAENYDSRKDYRRKAADVLNINNAQFKRSCRTRMTMNAVKVFKGKEKFFIPWSFDYRGRAYPIPAFLTPQDTDFGKSLLLFAEKATMTYEAEDWLRFQVSTTAGLDKETMKDRINWASHNHELITRIATDPIRNLSDWEEIDEPWQFLAACHEYYHTCILCDRNYTNLPVAVDATCSGLQILAGLARDASTAKLVNVLPSEKPQDAYKVIAEEAKPNVPESIRPFMDRKTTKRTVMTVPYNAKPFSNRGYIREALIEKGVHFANAAGLINTAKPEDAITHQDFVDKDIVVVSKEDLTATVNAVREAMNVIVPGPMKVMKWIEKEVGNAIDRGEQEIQWCTPSGFVVTQRLMKPIVETIELQLLGRCQIKVATEEGDKVDKAHHKNATAPNLIHSLDASLLHLSAIRFNAPLALIHDSVLCRATDMHILSAIVREVYMHLFAEQDYLTNWAAQIGAESEPPIIDTLNPESVIESTYFFC